MRAISIDKVNNIKSLLMSTKSNSKIAKQVRVSRTTVQKYRAALPVVRNVNKAGRKSLIGERLIRYITRLATQGRKRTAVDIQRDIKENFNMVVSDSTVRRALKKAGFVAFVKPRKPLLRAVNIKKRLQWAEEHKDWTVDDWKRVIFLRRDESEPLWL